MKISLKISSCFAWLSYGYFGSPELQEEPLRNNIVRFALRFLFLYATTQTFWLFLNLYYRSLLIFVAVEISRATAIFPPFSFELTTDDRIWLRFSSVSFTPDLIWVTNNTPFFISLLLSTSGLSLIARIRMISFGVAMLFATQLGSVYCRIYQAIFHNYRMWVKADNSLYGIMANIPDAARDFLFPVHYQMVGQYIFPLCIWAILVYCAKQNTHSALPYKLL